METPNGISIFPQSTRMAPSVNTILLAAASSAALLIAVGLRFSGSKPLLEVTEVSSKDVDPADCVQPEDVIAIFEALFVQMQKVLGQLSNQIQQIQMSGQALPEKQLRDLLRVEFERALVAQQKTIFEEHEVDEECLREATWLFLEQENEFPNVKRAVERFQKLYENICGIPVVGRRPGDGKGSKGRKLDDVVVQVISKEMLLKAASVYFDSLTSTMSSVMKDYKNKELNLNEKSVKEKLHMEFASKANTTGEEALEKIGVTLDGFQAAVKKYAQDREVGQTLAMLQMKQQQEFMSLGVPSM